MIIPKKLLAIIFVLFHIIVATSILQKNETLKNPKYYIAKKLFRINYLMMEAFFVLFIVDYYYLKSGSYAVYFMLSIFLALPHSLLIPPDKLLLFLLNKKEKKVKKAISICVIIILIVVAGWTIFVIKNTQSKNEVETVFRSYLIKLNLTSSHFKTNWNSNFLSKLVFIQKINEDDFHFETDGLFGVYLVTKLNDSVEKQIEFRQLTGNQIRKYYLLFKNDVCQKSELSISELKQGKLATKQLWKIDPNTLKQLNLITDEEISEAYKEERAIDRKEWERMGKPVKKGNS